jgi:hypothetical protein
MGVTIEDARVIGATLPRSYEALVRGEVRFRVGRIVYAAFYEDETIMGFGFPRQERAEAACLVVHRRSRYGHVFSSPGHRPGAFDGCVQQARPVARLVLEGTQLSVRLNAIEVVMALRRRVTAPVAAVRSVAVQDRPLTRGPFMADVRMGWAAGGAPLGTVATVGPRARYKDGRAFLVVWRNAASVVVDLGPNETSWRLLVISTRDAAATAAMVRSGAGLA